MTPRRKAAEAIKEAVDKLDSLNKGYLQAKREGGKLPEYNAKKHCCLHKKI